MTRKFTFLMTAMALILAIMGPRNVAWGQETATITFANQTSGTGDGSTAYTTSNFVSNGIASSDAAFGTITCSATEKCYSGKIDHGLKAGASSNAGSFTISFSSLSNVSKIVLNRASYNNSKTATITVKNGETTLADAVPTPSGTDAFSDMVIDNLNITSLSTLTVNTSKYCYIKSITITYSSGTTPTVAAPTFTPEGGTYYEDKTIELSAEEGCTIHYTLDGTTPTVESEEYEDAIQLTVPSTTTIKAIAVDGEGHSSNVASATYTLKRSQYTPAQLLAEVVPDNQSYIVVFTDEVIKSFYVYNNNNAGFYIETTEGDFLVYKSGTPSNWEVGGKVSGTVSGTWKTYNNLKEFCPANYNDFSYTQPTQQLPTPTGLTVSDLSMTGATLSWNAVEHASSYTVYVTDAAEYEETYTNITENSKVLNGLTAGTEYMWTVQAIGDGVTYLNSGIAEGEVFETPTTVLYDVIFETQQTGGTIEIDKTQAEAGEEVTANATAADHFSFTQWNFSPAVTISEGEITDDAITFIMPASDVTVTATFTEEAKYTVTYAKGGEDVTGEIPTVASYYAGETVEVAENPFSYVGHTFNGWSFNPSVEIVTIDDVDYFEMPASNVTVTATWEAKTPATIILKDKGQDYATVTGYVGDNLLATLAAAGVENPTGLDVMPDYEFAGWAQAKNTENPNIATTETTIADDITLYAVYANTTPGETTWNLVTDASSLAVGDVVVIAASGYNYAMSTQANNNRTAVEITKDNENHQISWGSETTTVQELTLTAGTVTEPTTFGLYTGSGYLYAPSSSSNQLKTRDENNDGNSSWAITITNNIASIVAQGTNSRKFMQYNPNNDNPIFACYGSSSQTALELYKENTTPGSTIYDFEESAKTLTVTYEANGADGEVPTESQLFAEGDEYRLASGEGLSKTHYTFAGWKANTDEQTYAAGSTYTFGSASVTFTAQWTEDEKYTVSYHVNGAVSTNDVYAGVMQLPVSVTAPNGYTFVGWTNQQISGVAESASYFSSYNVTGNVDLYAVFAIATKGGNSYRLSSTAPAAGDNVIVAGKKDDKYYALWVESTATSTELTIANGVVTNYEGLIWSASYDEYNEKYGIVLNNGTNPLHMNSSALKVASSNQNGTFEFPVSGDGFNIYGNQNIRWMTFNGTTFGVTSEEASASTLYFFMPVSFSNFCTTVTALSGNLAGATTEADKAYYISAAANVPANATATINGVLGNADASLLVINDGGQLIHHNAGVAATFQKNITAYADAEGNDGYYLIANPTDNETVVNLVNAEGYDLYTFDGAAELEWINMKSSPVVANDGIGYLYANSANVILGFAGEIIPAGSTDINLNYANKEFGGFNLIGNPFACNAYVGKSFYVIEGTELVLSENNYVAPCEGFFVEATEAGQSVTISTTAPEAPASLLSLSVSQNRGKAIDRAIVSFDSRNNLHKFMMNPNHTNISLAKNGEEFAAISTAAEGEMPVNFKAEKNGTYTITVSTENVEANYLHLIDNLTGADIDLLTTDSYTFDATTRDYASRFKLVFGVNNSNAEVNGNSFAYISNGELIISNEGRATLQVIDMTGRIVSSQEIEGEGHISTEGMTAGVYVLNLNGTTQKIVVR